MGGDRASAVLLDPLKDWEIAAVPHGFRSTFRDLACRLSRNMLHAVLHGKLDESLPEPDRLEAALTSTVFEHWCGPAHGICSLAGCREVPRVATRTPWREDGSAGFGHGWRLPSQTLCSGLMVRWSSLKRSIDPIDMM